MDAKEKAKELCKKYFRDSDLLVEDLTWIQAKECALIAVDEILKIESIEVPYWIEVYEEIEKL
jgi:hypothetical protein